MALGEYLISQGHLTKSRLEAALAEQSVTKEPLGRILVRNGFIRQDVLIEALRNQSPNALQNESALLPGVPADILISTNSMIVAALPDAVYVATLGSRTAAERALRPYVSGREIMFVPASPQRIDDYHFRIRQVWGGGEGDTLDSMLRKALDDGASDIHILPRRHSYTVLVRRLGVRGLEREGPLEEYLSLAAQIKDRARMDLAERRVPQDGGFSIEHNGRIVDMRVATLPTTEGETIVIRLLDPDRANPRLDLLGITRVAELRKALTRNEGLVLICGPTGSGKTTTMNAAIREMEVLEKAIYTIEDPVEYRIPYTGQVAVNETVKLGFATAVRAFMRADPDVIVVGEIRDLDTARNAIKAAETGHLVIGTLHTSSVHGVIGRLRDIGVEAHELRYLLRGVIAQRLLRTVCPKCKGEDGHCEVCGGSGYNHRTIVSEVVYLPDIASVEKVIAGETWWPSLMDDVLLKLENGITDEREVTRVFGAEFDDAKAKREKR